MAHDREIVARLLEYVQSGGPLDYEGMVAVGQELGLHPIDAYLCASFLQDVLGAEMIDGGDGRATARMTVKDLQLMDRDMARYMQGDEIRDFGDRTYVGRNDVSEMWRRK